MKATITIFGIIVALGGTFCGFLDWFLSNFYLDTVDWEGPMVTVSKCLWLLNTLGVGFGVVLLVLVGYCDDRNRQDSVAPKARHDLVLHHKST